MFEAKWDELANLTLFEAVKVGDALSAVLADHDRETGKGPFSKPPKTPRGTILRFRVDMGPVDEDIDNNEGNIPAYRKAN